jgi:hypothetical protein
VAGPVVARYGLGTWTGIGSRAARSAVAQLVREERERERDDERGRDGIEVRTMHGHALPRYLDAWVADRADTVATDAAISGVIV